MAIKYSPFFLLLRVTTLIIDEGILEGCGPLLCALLIDDDELAHKVEEASCVGVRIAGRDLATIAHI